MACLEHLEEMSALLDGELTAEESTRLERHMATCPACRQAFEAMTGLGSALTAVEPPPLPSDFTRKAAEYVRQHAFPSGPPPTPPVRPRRWFDSFLHGQHPILALVGARKRRPSLRTSEMLKALAIFALPALALAVLRDGMPLLNFVLVAGLGLMVAVPVYYFNNELALVGSLIRGRCLEEVLGTSLEPDSTVDALAGNSLRSILRALVPVAPVLIVGALLIPEGAHYGVTLTTNDHQALLTATLLWMPVTLVLFLSASYVALAWRIWARSTRTSVVGGLLLALAAPVLFLGKAALPAGLVLAVLFALLGRRLAISGLERPELVTRVNQTTRKARRNRFLKLWSDNPITAREIWRVSGSVPGGIGGVFAWRLTLLVMPLLWAFWAITRPYKEQDWAFWLGVGGFSFLLFLRAAYRTLGSVLSERQQQTWEPLLQTDLGAARFVRGWLEVAFHTVMLEGLVGGLTLTLFAWYLPFAVTTTQLDADAHRLALLVPLVLLFVTVVGALTGMALSASTRTLSEASQRLGLLAGLLLGGWLLLWGVMLSGGYLLALQSQAETGGLNWDDFVQHDSPLGAALLLALGLMLWSNSVLRREVTRLESEPARGATLRFSYPLPAVLLELSGLGVVSYLSLVLSVLVSASFGSSRDDNIGLAMMLAVLVGWMLLVRLPLATLAELWRGSRKSILLGALLGALAGACMQLMPGVINYLTLSKTIRENYWITRNLPAFLPFTPALLIFFGLGLGWIESRREPSRRRAALKPRLLLSGLAGLVLVGGGAFALVSSWQVELTSPSTVAEIRSRTEERLGIELDRENGYALLHTLLTTRRPTPDPAWAALANLDENQKEELMLQALHTPEGQVARESFLSKLPLLERALEQPRFSCQQSLDPSARVPNFILIRSIARGMMVLGLEEEHQGNLDQALRYDLMGLKWGDRWSGQGPLIFEMIAVACESYPVDNLLLLESRQQLEAGQYRAIIRQVEQSRFQPESLAEALEAEMVMGQNLLAQDSIRRGTSEPVLGLPLPERYLRYEETNLCNFYLSVLPAARKNTLPMRFSRPRLSLMAGALVAAPERAQEQMLLLLTRLEAIRTIAALKLYHLERGNYPQNLDELATSGYLSHPVTAWVAPDHRFDYQVQGPDFRLSTRSPRVRLGSKQRKQWDFYPYQSVLRD